MIWNATRTRIRWSEHWRCGRWAASAWTRSRSTSASPSGSASRWYIQKSIPIPNWDWTKPVPGVPRHDHWPYPATLLPWHLKKTLHTVRKTAAVSVATKADSLLLIGCWFTYVWLARTRTHTWGSGRQCQKQLKLSFCLWLAVDLLTFDWSGREPLPTWGKRRQCQ